MTQPALRPRTTPDPWDVGFGVVLFVAAVMAITVWFPHDIKGGFIEQGFAGKSQPGDAFFPVLLAVALAALALLQVVISVVRPSTPDRESGRLSVHNLGFLLRFHLLVAAGIALMVWLGPLTLAAMQGLGLTEHAYRQVSDTVPYKYLGYVTGGFLMTVGLIAWAEGRIRATAIVSVVTVLALVVVLFDVALSNVLLPPNADQ